jgi:toxin ParE1/3/4
MRLIWSDRSKAQLRAISQYISQHDDNAADRLLDRITANAERLIDYPYMYREGRIAGTREALVHPNYLLIYRVTADSVRILRVLHTRQQYP